MREKHPEKAVDDYEDIMDQGEPDVMMAMGKVMSIFPQYDLDALLDMPLLKAEMLMEQAEYIFQTRMYLDRLNAITSKVTSII